MTKSDREAFLSDRIRDCGTYAMISIVLVFGSLATGVWAGFLPLLVTVPAAVYAAVCAVRHARSV